MQNSFDLFTENLVIYEHRAKSSASAIPSTGKNIPEKNLNDWVLKFLAAPENLNLPTCSSSPRQLKATVNSEPVYCLDYLQKAILMPPAVSQQPSAPKPQQSSAPKPPLPSKSAPKELQRRYPPLGYLDTAFVNSDGLAGPKKGYGNVFEDHEIVQCRNVVARRLLEDVEKGSKEEIYAEYTAHGKAIIQQQAANGCTAAAAAMLIVDNGGRCSIKKLQSRKVEPFAQVAVDIKNAYFNPIESTVKSISSLQSALKKDGPAVVGIGGHVIIVDEITENHARIRDPYHGWEITITLEALKEKLIFPIDIIQIARRIA